LFFKTAMNMAVVKQDDEQDIIFLSTTAHN